MKIYQSIDEYARQGYRSDVALGYFDGVHEGHRAVIRLCTGQDDGAVKVVLTFRDSPAAALGREAPPYLTDNEEKALLMWELGIEAVIFADFETIRELSAGTFVTQVLKEKLRARTVACGYNYRFGRGGAGDTAALTALCAGEGIAVFVADPVTAAGETVSSTRIRELLSEGEIPRANTMLGHPYTVGGTVERGNSLGSAMGYPTVNIPMDKGRAIPRYGVYASRITIAGERFRGATNIGVHPSVGENDRPLCESFLIGYGGGALYGAAVICEPVRFLRPERRFSSLEALQAQIERDVEEVRCSLGAE